MPRAARHPPHRYIINRDCYPRRPESVLAPFDVDANAREKRPARPCYSAVMPLSSSPVSIVAVLGLMLIAVGTGGVSAPALAQSPALAAYDTALRDFRAILAERRAQIDAKRPLPNLPGQAVYLARLQGDEHLQGPDRRGARAHRPAQQVRRAAGLLRRRHRAADRGVRGAVHDHAGAAGGRAGLATRRSRTSPISAGRSRAPRASMPPPPTRRAASPRASSSPRPTATRTSATPAPTPTRAACRRASRRIARGAAAWAALRPRIAALDPAVAARDDQETARVGKGDQRFNHWTAVRNGLMNAHAELFARSRRSRRCCPTRSTR